MNTVRNIREMDDRKSEVIYDGCISSALLVLARCPPPGLGSTTLSGPWIGTVPVHRHVSRC